MKKDLDSLLVEHYKKDKAKKLGPNLLLEMIQEVMGELSADSRLRTLMEQVEERVIRFPKIKITEKWGEKHNEDREIFETMMSNVYGKTVQEKLANVAEFLNHKEGLTVAEILSNMMFVEIFSNILEEFNPSTAGFLFEAFLAGLFRGVQIADPEGGSLPITDVEIPQFVQRGFGETEEIVDYSLKVLSPNTDLKGSFVNLVNFFRDPKKPGSVTYLAVTKEGGTGPVGRLLFYEFTINEENFFDWIGHETITADRVLDTVEFTPSVDGTVDGNRLKLGDLVIGGNPRTGKMTEDGFVKAPNTKANLQTRAAYDEIPVEEINVFYPASYALKDPSISGKKSDYGLGMSLEGHRLTAGDVILMDRTYEVTLDTGGKNYVRTGERSTGHGKLYGDVIADWDMLINNPELIPGYAQNKQWHISPRYYREMGELIGELDLSSQKLKDVFEAYASNLGESLVNLYNSLADLSININKYFLASDKAAGMAAIGNAESVKDESEKLIGTEDPAEKAKFAAE